MMKRRPHTGATTAALFALLMLSFASVRSIVMQAVMAPSTATVPICGQIDASNAGAVTMAGMRMQRAIDGSVQDHQPGAPQQHQAACAYCAAAGHAPILAQSVPLRLATPCVFTAYQQVASHGPRGPPAQPPRARGPPSDPLTA